MQLHFIESRALRADTFSLPCTTCPLCGPLLNQGVIPHVACISPSQTPHFIVLLLLIRARDLGVGLLFGTLFCDGIILHGQLVLGIRASVLGVRLLLFILFLEVNLLLLPDVLAFILGGNLLFVHFVQVFFSFDSFAFVLPCLSRPHDVAMVLLVGDVESSTLKHKRSVTACVNSQGQGADTWSLSLFGIGYLADVTCCEERLHFLERNCTDRVARVFRTDCLLFDAVEVLQPEEETMFRYILRLVW